MSMEKYSKIAKKIKTLEFLMLKDYQKHLSKYLIVESGMRQKKNVEHFQALELSVKENGNKMLYNALKVLDYH